MVINNFPPFPVMACAECWGASSPLRPAPLGEVFSNYGLHICQQLTSLHKTLPSADSGHRNEPFGLSQWLTASISVAIIVPLHKLGSSHLEGVLPESGQTSLLAGLEEAYIESNFPLRYPLPFPALYPAIFLTI